MADATVQLNVTAGAPPDDTWRPCQHESEFHYKFTGGNTDANDGSLEFEIGTGTKFIDIELICADGFNPNAPPTSPGYRITGVDISYDNNVSDSKKDISVFRDTDPRCWQLKNKDADLESGEFSVVVSYTGPAGSNPPKIEGIGCDPGWKNKN